MIQYVCPHCGISLAHGAATKLLWCGRCLNYVVPRLVPK